ncbi:TonB-dependent receptor domain protein [Nitrospirillum viridazoti Y2]|nr:TonB-dependent receptor domain protein [Nitrospirillum amazonense Y2]
MALLATAAVLGLLNGTTPAGAQTNGAQTTGAQTNSQPPAPQGAAGDALDVIQEIVVTAQKRAENVQDIPVAVTVVSGDALAKAGVSAFADVTKLAPSMTVSAGDQPANSAIVIRGIGTFAYSIGVEPSVLVVIDDVAMGMQAQAFTDLADIDRIEVLRGPQSTLFGKSASAGVVSVTTKAPTDTFTAYGDISFTDDDEQRTNVSISGPLSDTLGFRLTASQHQFGGNVHNLATDDKLDADRSWSLHGKLRWKPTDRFEGELLAHYNKEQSNCCVGTLARVDSGALLFGIPGATPSKVLPGVVPGTDNTNVSQDQAPRSDTLDYGGSLHVTYDFDDMALISITGWNKYRLNDHTDLDGTAQDTLGMLTPYTGAGGQVTPASHGGMIQGGTFDARTFSQEFRLASHDATPFGYLAGIYASDEDLVRGFYRGPYTRVGAANWRGEAQYQNYAAFGQTTWTFLPDWTLITGLRINREEGSYSFNDYYKQAFYPLAGASTGNGDTVATGKVGLQYQVTPDIMAFATYSRGYKGLAYDLTSSFNAVVAANQPIRPEMSNNYELGVKSELFDRHLVLNATVYDTEYTDFQVQSIVPGVTTNFLLTNVGGVRTRGLELDWLARLTPEFSLTGGFAYTDARVTDFPYAQCYNGQACSLLPAPLNVQNLAGKRLPNAPEEKFNIGASYHLALGGLPVYSDINLNYSWQSKVNFSLTQDPGTVQDAYGIANLSISFVEKDDKRYSLTLFANNLFDQHYAANMGNVRGTWGVFAYTQTIPRDYNRYLGMRLGFNY